MTAYRDYLEQKIVETEKIIEQIKTTHSILGFPDYVSDLEISSLTQRSNDLQKQLDEIKDLVETEELEVVLNPPDLPSGQIEIRTLTTILGGLQTLTDSVANTLFNQQSNRGPIPQNLLEGNSWVLKNVRAGSFIAVLDLKHEQVLAFDEAPQTQVISELFELFDAADKEESLVDVISELGPRTLKHYADWTKSLKDLNTPFEINWRSAVKGVSKVSFNPNKADRIYGILNEKLSSQEEEVELNVRLTGVNVRTGLFEIYSLNGIKTAGRITKDTIEKAVAYLNKRCKVKLLKITAVSSAGKENIKWVLTDIESE